MSWLRSPATYALAVAAAVAMLTYSTALQRGTVTQATAPLVVGETVAPALVGLLLLGDEPRQGWGWVATVGFAMAVGGAVSLARHGEITEDTQREGAVGAGPTMPAPQNNLTQAGSQGERARDD